MKYFLSSVALVGSILLSCNSNSGKEEKSMADSTNANTETMTTYKQGSFGYDVDFLEKNDSGLIVLSSEDGKAQMIVSPKYQAKVFTSTADGFAGKSFGWVNYKAFEGELDAHMNAYGGEDRLWLGPEGGKFSLFFAKDAKMNFDNWHTPAAFDSESWQLVSNDKNAAVMRKEMNLTNYAGTPLQLKIDRLIALIHKDAINTDLQISIPDNVKAVAFSTVNAISNVGNNEWNEADGAPCIWNLDMFTPSEQCTIVIPYNNNAAGKVATTDYFGEISKDRIKYENGILFFKADGKSRGKLGIPPNRVKNVAGSYDAKNNVLTVIKYDIDPSGNYLNQEWRTDREPFSGDAMNAYNDGPLENGSQMGPFYELESVSKAAFLKPGEKWTHKHNVYHFVGDKTALDSISKKVFGISVDEIVNAFK